MMAGLTRAYPTRESDLNDKPVIRVWSDREPSFGGLLGLSRSGSYAAVHATPNLAVRVGRNLFVKTSEVRKLVGLQGAS